MSNPIFTSTFANMLQDNLDTIAHDKTDGHEKKLVLKKWCTVEGMSDAFVDDLDIVGPGLASEKDEGTETAIGTMQEHYLTRYWARTFAIRLIITEEAIEDLKDKETIDLSMASKRSMFLTADYDATNILARGFNTDYVGGDDLPLFSASHTLVEGGTYSNLMSTPMSPSMASLAIARTQIFDWPGRDGLVTFIDVKKAVFPNAQWGTWANILKAELNPVAGNFAELNIVNSEMDITPVRNPFWRNSSTNWALITDADNGIKFKWRVKPAGRTWVDENPGLMNQRYRARWARGWTNPRGAYGVNA